MENKSVFETLNKIDCSYKIEKKNGLSYLSWAWAWTEVKKLYPNANYTIYERETEYGPVNYFTDGKTCWVKTGVTIEGLEHIEELPVMDFKNKSIPLNNVTSFDVNKTIQRSLTKAMARHGLGLWIFAGEDLPEDESSAKGQTVSSGDVTELATKVQNYYKTLNNEYKKIVMVSMKQANTNKLSELPLVELEALINIAENGKGTFGG